MKKVLCALGLMFTAVSSALATTYPLTIENCGYQETFTRPPERVVALGQNTVEILLLLGLQKQVVASAFWPTSVLPQLAEQIPISFPPSYLCYWGRKAKSLSVKISLPSA